MEFIQSKEGEIQREAWCGSDEIWRPRECVFLSQILLKLTPIYGKGGTR
jgi:hypothetical protein